MRFVVFVVLLVYEYCFAATSTVLYDYRATLNHMDQLIKWI